MSELAHDGPLLQELDSVILFGRQIESLNGHVQGRTVRFGLPHPFVHCTKLARPQMLSDPTELRYQVITALGL